MTEGNNNTAQKNPENRSKTNKSNNYYRYKKSGGAAKNTTPSTDSNTKPNTRPNTRPQKSNTARTTVKPAEKTESVKSENTGAQSNFNKNRNYKKKIYNSKRTRFTRNSSEETVDEIKTDIRRIEKEIRLEIEEIKSLKV